MTAQRALVLGAAWLTRLSALALRRFWGSFFMAHLGEWFLAADRPCRHRRSGPGHCCTG